MYELIIVLHVPVPVSRDERTERITVVWCVCVCVFYCSGCGVYWRCYLGHVTARALWCTPRLARFTVSQVRPWDDQSAWPYSVSAVQIDAGRPARVVGQSADGQYLRHGWSFVAVVGQTPAGPASRPVAVWLGPAGSSQALTDRTGRL